MDNISFNLVLKHSNVGILRTTGGRAFQRVDPRNIILFLNTSLLGKGVMRTAASCSLVLPSVLSK